MDRKLQKEYLNTLAISDQKELNRRDAFLQEDLRKRMDHIEVGQRIEQGAEEIKNFILHSLESCRKQDLAYHQLLLSEKYQPSNLHFSFYSHKPKISDGMIQIIPVIDVEKILDAIDLIDHSPKQYNREDFVKKLEQKRLKSNSGLFLCVSLW